MRSWPHAGDVAVLFAFRVGGGTSSRKSSDSSAHGGLLRGLLASCALSRAKLVDATTPRDSVGRTHRVAAAKTRSAAPLRRLEHRRSRARRSCWRRSWTPNRTPHGRGELTTVGRPVGHARGQAPLGQSDQLRIRPQPLSRADVPSGELNRLEPDRPAFRADVGRLAGQNLYQDRAQAEHVRSPIDLRD